MSNYTPSMHYFRQQYANKFVLEADVIRAEERFDRALATHDAEVRARTFAEAAGVARNYDTGYDTTAATIAEALTDAAAWRAERAGVVAEEPEGEHVFIERYGIYHAQFGGIGGDVTSLTLTREAWKAMDEPDVLAVTYAPAKQEGAETDA